MTELKRIRTVFDMTQAEMAKVLGTNREHISRMENGRVPISAVIRDKLHQWLLDKDDELPQSISPDDLPGHYTPDEKRRILLYGQTMFEKDFTMTDFNVFLQWQDQIRATSDGLHKPSEEEARYILRLLEGLPVLMSQRRSLECKLEKETRRLENFNSAPCGNHAERIKDENGVEIYFSVPQSHQRSNVKDFSYNNKLESNLFSLSLTVMLVEDIKTRLLMCRDAHFIVDYLALMPAKELTEKYGISAPKKHMIQLIKANIMITGKLSIPMAASDLIQKDTLSA